MIQKNNKNNSYHIERELLMWYIFYNSLDISWELNCYLKYITTTITLTEKVIKRGIEGMIEKRYIISDAAKIVEVESHVLRYWEDELRIEIPRNEMGHRYYTDFYINLFKKIKELKDAGFQLKAIKMMIPELMEMEKSGEVDIEMLKEELFGKITEVSDEESVNNIGQAEDKSELVIEKENKIALPKVYDTGNLPENRENKYKLEQFQAIINEVVSNALRENTGLLGKEVSDIVSDNVIKEMDYLMHIREKQEEERFKKLDETIRNYQILGKERQKDKKGILSKIKNFGM